MSEVVASQVSVRDLKTHLSAWLVNQPLVETAGRFADVFALRGYDSVQIAAVHELHINVEQTVVFASYDRRLNQDGNQRAGQFRCCSPRGKAK